MNNVLHCECVKFVFLTVIQKELDDVTNHWNLHKVRKMNNVNAPSGKPEFMFHNPSAFVK